MIQLLIVANAVVVVGLIVYRLLKLDSTVAYKIRTNFLETFPTIALTDWDTYSSDANIFGHSELWPPLG